MAAKPVTVVVLPQGEKEETLLRRVFALRRRENGGFPAGRLWG